MNDSARILEGKTALVTGSGRGLGRAFSERLAALGCETRLRMTDDHALLTDNHNFIVDCAFPDGIDDPGAMEQAINTIPGVLDNGLFVGMADAVFIGTDNNVERLP